MTTEIEVNDIEDDDGCGTCIVCRFRLLVGDMADALARLKAERKAEAMNLLCVAVADAEAYLASDEFADEVEGWSEEDDALADMVPAGRA